MRICQTRTTQIRLLSQISIGDGNTVEAEHTRILMEQIYSIGSERIP